MKLYNKLEEKSSVSQSYDQFYLQIYYYKVRDQANYQIWKLVYEKFNNQLFNQLWFQFHNVRHQFNSGIIDETK